MSENVVSLRGKARVFAPGEADPDIVTFCEKLVEDARAGRLRAIAIASVSEGGRHGCGWSGGYGTPFGLAGAILMLSHRFGQRCIDMPSVDD